MPLLTPYLLDRANDLLVHWRLRGRQPVTDRAALRAYVASPPDPLHPPVESLSHFEPRARAGASGTWEAVSPWPAATGRNRRWIATRILAHAPTGGAATGAVIMLHGWLLTRWQFPLYCTLAKRLSRRGVEVWLPRLPYHIERAEPAEVSGGRCLSADLITSAEALRQAVAETRALAAWLRAGGTQRVGLWGTSLGGWVAGLVATLDDRLSGVALWAPVADPAEVLWHSRVAVDLRRGVMAGGLGPEDGEFALDRLAPSSRPLAISRSAALLVGAIRDGIVTPGSVRRLARRWGIDVRWEPHGHISLMAAPGPAAATIDFLA